MRLSRNAARALNFAVIAVLFLLAVTFIENGTPIIAIAVAAVQTALFIFIDRYFKVVSKTKTRLVLKYVLTAIGIFAVTCTVLGVLKNNGYAVYTYNSETEAVSFLSAMADTLPRILYALIQLLPVLMLLVLVFNKAFFFPVSSLYAFLVILTNNITVNFGPFSEYSGIVREYTVGSAAGSVTTAMIFLIIASAIVTAGDLYIHRPKKSRKVKFALTVASLVIGVILTVLAIAAA